MNIAMNILRRIPDVGFGPDIVTWPKLVTAFAASAKTYEYNGEHHIHSALTLASSEFGNLVNPQDREMIDLLVKLWDSEAVLDKQTKTSGDDKIENPWINIIACTTPAWIAGTFPEYVISGGFTSRCVFIYAEKKDKLIAYPSKVIPKGLKDRQTALAQDLEHIATTLVGPYKLDEAAVKWGEVWYQHHYDNPPELLSNDRFGGYLARKQTHIHKLAMILAASQRDELIITADDLALAHRMVSDLEADMPMVFSKIGRTEESIQAERFIKFVHTQTEGISFEEAYHYVHIHFPKLRDFEAILYGGVRSGQLSLSSTPQGQFIRPMVPKEKL